MRIDVVTIFPDYLAPLDLSLIGKARRDGLLDVRVHDLREFAHDRHRTVDDTPYGGGAGMVMKPQPWAEALQHVAGSGPQGARPRLVVPGPGGMPFTQALARELAEEPWLAFACGRYEGIDERVYEYAADELGLEVSVVSLGDYVLNGGEVAVLAMVEAVARLLPGVIGNAESLVEESHEDGLLEYPVYTKPAAWESAPGRVREVPPVLLSGDHGAIADWRHQQRLERTAARRPDLLHGSQAGAELADFDLATATPADVPELLTLSRACWVTEAQANDTLDIPPLVETLEETAAGIAAVDHLDRACRRPAGRVGARLGSHPTTTRSGRSVGSWWLPTCRAAVSVARCSRSREAQAPPGTTAYWLNTGVRSDRNLRIYRKAGYRVRPGAGSHPGTVDLTKPRR